MRTITENGQTTAYFEAPSRLWHDLGKTIPAQPGMTVAFIEVFAGGKPSFDLVQPVMARRPVCVMDVATGEKGVRLEVDDSMLRDAAWNVQTIYDRSEYSVALSKRPLSPRVTTTFRVETGNPPMNHPDFKWPE
jgi:hypothetical protein